MSMLLLTGSAAGAHAIVVSASPAMNATVATGDLDVRIQFNSEIDRKRSRLLLEAPDTTLTSIELAPDSPGGILMGRVRTAIDGRWTIRWQVLSVDGHITRGEIGFFVRGAGAH